MTDRKRFERMDIKSKFSPIAVLNFLAVCNFGRILHSLEMPDGNEVDCLVLQARNVDYAVQIVGDESLVLQVAEGSEVPQSEDDYLQLLNIYFGAKILGAEVKLSGLWCERLPGDEFFAKHLSDSEMLKDVAQGIHHEICLTLNDIEEVHKHLVGEKRGASDLLMDKEFRTIFPSIQQRWGEYGFMRHRSGTEIRTQWLDTQFVYSHGYEAPSPSEKLLEKWHKHKGLEWEKDFFKRHRQRKWNLACFLNKVPAQDKQRVYEWVDDTIFDIEQYHDTRGGNQVPELAECQFANCILTVDRNYNFELIEC